MKTSIRHPCIKLYIIRVTDTKNRLNMIICFVSVNENEYIAALFETLSLGFVSGSVGSSLLKIDKYIINKYTVAININHY